MQSDGLQVKTTVKVDSGNDVSLASLAPWRNLKKRGGAYCSVGTMPDTPPVVTASLSGTFPFVMVAAPFVVGATTAAAAPFIPAPVEEEVGRARSDVWSAWDMGKESEDGETNALAWAAVVGRVRDSMMATISMLGTLLDKRLWRGRGNEADERRGLKWTTAEAAGNGGRGRSKKETLWWAMG
jgi:hypothetical protein